MSKNYLPTDPTRINIFSLGDSLVTYESHSKGLDSNPNYDLCKYSDFSDLGLYQLVISANIYQMFRF